MRTEMIGEGARPSKEHRQVFGPTTLALSVMLLTISLLPFAFGVIQLDAGRVMVGAVGMIIGRLGIQASRRPRPWVCPRCRQRVRSSRSSCPRCEAGLWTGP